MQRRRVRPGKWKKAAAEAKPRPQSKSAEIIELLRRPEGATLHDLMAASGWQAHSVRGFLRGAVGKKMGLQVKSTKSEDGQRVYAIAWLEKQTRCS